MHACVKITQRHFSRFWDILAKNMCLLKKPWYCVCLHSLHTYLNKFSLDSTLRGLSTSIKQCWFLLPVLVYKSDVYITGWKKRFPLRGNIMESTSLQQMSMGFPSSKLPFSMWFPSRGNTLRSGLNASIEGKLGSTSGFPIWKIRGNYIETPGFQRETWGKPKGNPGFPM